MPCQNVHRAVVDQLALLSLPGINCQELEDSAHLIDDIGLDSLKLVDLTVGLESALGLAEFPMQDWVDNQLANDRPLTLGELVKVCSSLVR